MGAKSAKSRGRGTRTLRVSASCLAVFCSLGMLSVLVSMRDVCAGSSSSSSSISSFATLSHHEHPGRRLNAGAPTTCVGDGAPEIAASFAVIAFCFLGLAIVCDEFFQPSLEIISEELNLSPDVAGATFLAAGSSAPELFTSVGDVFGPANSMGLGTIVGSAMFNILVIVALSAAVAPSGGGDLLIDRRPVLRDVSFYSASIACLAVFFQDGQIVTWEAAVMVAAYGMYIVWMVFNQRLFGICCKGGGGGGDDDGDGGATVAPLKPGGDGAVSTSINSAPTDGAAAAAATAADKKAANHEAILKKSKLTRMASFNHHPHHNPAKHILTRREMRTSIAEAEAEAHSDALAASLEAAGEEPKTAAGGDAAAAAAAKKDDVDGGDGSSEDDGDDESRLAWPKDGSASDKVFFVLAFPLTLAFTLTIPDCDTEKWAKWYVVSFVMSIAWIAALCGAMVQAATLIGCVWNVTPVVMGVVVLAVGTSVPDAIGSMIAAKSGEADMAIANAIGSNIFDIFLGLGLPWLLFTATKGTPYVVDKDGIFEAVVILFCTVFLFLAVLVGNRWKMTTLLGRTLFGLYIVYVGYVVAKEALRSKE